MADIAQLGFRVDSSQVRSATSDLRRMDASGKAASKATDDLTKAGKNNSFQMRQTAMQLSQVASQGAVTGNYLQALAIQLPDLALAFGPVAIIAGALAGSLAGPLISALTGASRSIEDLKEATDMLSGAFDEAADGSYEFSKELVRLARISEEIAQLKVTLDTEEARKNVLRIGDAIRESFAELTGDQSLSALDKLAGTTLSDKIAEELGITADEARELGIALGQAQQSTDPESYNVLAEVLGNLVSKYSDNYGSVRQLAGGLLELVQTGAEAAQVFQRLSSAGDDFDEMLKRSTTDLDGLQTAIPRTSYSLSDFFAEQTKKIRRDQEERERLADAAQATYQRLLTADVSSQFSAEEAAAQTLGQTMAQYQMFLDEKLISDDQYQEARIAAEERYYSRINELREEDRQNQIGFNSGTLSAFGMMVGDLTEIAAMGGEEQFDTWKRLAQAQAGISAAMGALSVIGDPTIPTALKPFAIGTMVALAGAQIAQIEQQEYRAREFGGQVAPGTSYIVGERGPEVLTIGSQGGMITPNNQMQGESNTFVMNISTGVQASVRAEMVALMPTIARMAKQVSAAQSKRSGR